MRSRYLAWLRYVVIGIILMLMAFFVPSGAMQAAEASTCATYAPLPLEDIGGPEPDSSRFTETTYSDPTLDIEIFFDSTETTEYIYVHILIADPTQLRSAAASHFNSMTTYTATSIAKRVNAVLAINGDYFNYVQRLGYIVRQGKRYRNAPTGADLLLIDSQGNFHSLCGADSRELVEAYLASLPDDIEIQNTFSFGPFLIDNGKLVITENKEYFNVSSEKKTQRMGLGQLGPLEYFIVSTEGPEDNKDSGLTIAEFALLMQEIGYKLSDTGALYAYNLDGGSSNTLVFNNQKINSSDRRKIRPVGDIIYFCTLIDSSKP